MTHTYPQPEITLINPPVISAMVPVVHTSNIISIVNENFIISAPNNFAKALLIDLPGDLNTLEPYKAFISFGGYSIRSTIKESLKEAFNLNDDTPLFNILASVAAGFAGGAFKYYLTGQNPYVGMINNAAYELCNDYQYCIDNEASFTFAIEIIDSVLQTSIGLATGNTLGVSASSIALFNAFIEGANAAIYINHNAENFYNTVTTAFNLDLAGSIDESIY